MVPNPTEFPADPSESRFFYSNKEIAILHDIVTSAQNALPTLPERDRLPTNALFRAYYGILPQYNIDPDSDFHLSKLLFRVGGEKSDKSLSEKFQDILARLGIELEFDPAPSPTHQSLAHEAYPLKPRISLSNDIALPMGKHELQSDDRKLGLIPSTQVPQQQVEKLYKAHENHDFADIDSRLDKQATRAHELWVIQRVLGQWVQPKIKVDERTFIARRHMLRFRYFTAWHHHASPCDREESLFLRDQSSSQHEITDMLPNTSLNMDVLKHLMEKVAIRFRNDYLAKALIRRWVDFSITNHGTLATLRTSLTCRILDKSLGMWVIPTKMDQLIELLVSYHSSSCIQHWRSSSMPSQTRSEDFRFRVRSVIQIVLSRWRKTTANDDLNQTSNGHLIQPNGNAAGSLLAIRIFKSIAASAEENNYWRDKIQAISESRLRQMGAWASVSQYHAKLHQWARRGNYYFCAIRVFESWRGATARLLKTYRKKSYAHMKQDARARLTVFILVNWKDLLVFAKHLHQQAGINQSLCLLSRLTQVIIAWHKDSGLQARAQHISFRYLWQRGMAALESRLASDEILAYKYALCNTQRIHLQCVGLWEIAVLQIKGLRHTSSGVRQLRHRKLLRLLVRDWASSLRNSRPSDFEPHSGVLGLSTTSSLLGQHSRPLPRDKAMMSSLLHHSTPFSSLNPFRQPRAKRPPPASAKGRPTFEAGDPENFF